MSEQPPQSTPNRNAEKDPSEWVTGNQPMTGPQESYLSPSRRRPAKTSRPT
jgi:hypothetical protein